jgi:hypothetical protein
MIFKKIGNMENVEVICHYFFPNVLLFYPSDNDFATANGKNFCMTACQEVNAI